MTADAEQDIVRSLDALDKLLEHRLRLALCVLLTRFEDRGAEVLRHSGANLRKLEDAGYVRVKKMHVDRKPVSWYSIAANGRKALRNHLDALAGVIGTVAD